MPTAGLDGELLACGNPNDGGDWVIGRSFDFGHNWEPVLERFEQTVHRKDCPETSKTVKCCRGRCPGDAEMCGQPLNPEWPPECYEVDGLSTDADTGVVQDGASVVDLGLTGMDDVGTFGDAGVENDALSTQHRPKSSSRTGTHGCSSVSLGAPSWFMGFIVMSMLFGLPWRRKW